MKAIILAAGIASRLRPLTDCTPKCLLKIGERSLLQRTIDALIENSINELIIVTGYRQQQIVDFVNQNYPKLPVTFVYNEQYSTTNNIYSLYLTRPFINNEDVLLLDSDIVFDPQVISVLLQTKEESALAVNCHELGEEEIKVIVDKEMKVLEISKTCSIEEAMGESIGIEKMHSNYLSALFDEMEVMIEKEGLNNVFYELAFERIIKNGHCFYAINTSDCFSAELDTVEDFQEAQNLIPATLY